MTFGRRGEPPNTLRFRSRRIYIANSGWYFDSREGVQFGPFVCRSNALCALAVYIAQHICEYTPTSEVYPEQPGTQDEIDHLVEEALQILERYRDFGVLAAGTWAKSRIEELRSGNRTPAAIGKIRVLEFSLNHPEQTFDFECFLESRAG